jgi:hypothetical protein
VIASSLGGDNPYLWRNTSHGGCSDGVCVPHTRCVVRDTQLDAWVESVSERRGTGCGSGMGTGGGGWCIEKEAELADASRRFEEMCVCADKWRARREKAEGRVAGCSKPELSLQPSRPALRSCALNARDSRVSLAPRREVKKRKERKKNGERLSCRGAGALGGLLCLKFEECIVELFDSRCRFCPSWAAHTRGSWP